MTLLDRRDHERRQCERRAVRPRVLIVDDEVEVIELWMRAFQLFPQPYDVEFARSGDAAIELCEQAVEKGEPFSLALMDIAMPAMYGIEAARRIKEISPTTHFAFCTAFDSAMNKIESQDVGAVGYWTKPITPDVLQANIRSVLGL